MWSIGEFKTFYMIPTSTTIHVRSIRHKQTIFTFPILYPHLQVIHRQPPLYRTSRNASPRGPSRRFYILEMCVFINCTNLSCSLGSTEPIQRTQHEQYYKHPQPIWEGGVVRKEHVDGHRNEIRPIRNAEMFRALARSVISFGSTDQQCIQMYTAAGVVDINGHEIVVFCCEEYICICRGVPYVAVCVGRELVWSLDGAGSLDVFQQDLVAMWFLLCSIIILASPGRGILPTQTHLPRVSFCLSMFILIALAERVCGEGACVTCVAIRFIYDRYL